MKSTMGMGRNNIKRGVFFVAGIITGTVILASASAQAMPGSVFNGLKAESEPTNISPTPDAFRLYNKDDKPKGGLTGTLFNSKKYSVSSGKGFKHLLKNERSSYITKVQITAYFDKEQFKTREQVRDAVIAVKTASQLSADCKFDLTSNANKLKVTFGGKPAKKVGAKEKYEANATKGNQNNVCNNNGDNKSPDRFSGEYSIGDASIQDKPGLNMWAIPLEFELVDNARNKDADKTQQIRFQVATYKPNKKSKGQYLGVTRLSRPTEFGVAEGFSKEVEYGAAAAVPFGLSCDEDNLTSQGIDIYDADTERFGPSYVSVLARNDGGSWEKLEGSDFYLRGQRGTDSSNEPKFATWRADDKRFELSAENGTSRITLREVRRTTDYILIVDNPYDKSAISSPVANVLSVSLPGDSISTVVDCDHNLRPKVTLGEDQDSYTRFADLDVTTTITNKVSGKDVNTAFNESHPWETYMLKFSEKPSNIDALKDIRRNASFCDVVAKQIKNPAPESCIDNRYIDRSNFRNSDGVSQESTKQYSSNEDDAPGTWRCFVARVKQPLSDNPPGRLGAGDNDWRYSSMACSQSGVKPKVQVRGYDFKAGGNINVSTTQSRDKTYGSWGEYGVFSTGTNKRMASGGGLWGGSDAGQQNWSDLTFANKDNVFGKFGVLPVPGETMSGEELPLVGNKFCTLEEKPYAVGLNRTYYCRGTLIINGSQTYTGFNAYGNINDIQRIKLIAKNIVIANAATRIDPWLIALEGSAGNGGKISTCKAAMRGNGSEPGHYFPDFDEINGGLSIRKCENGLTFNGPVVASELYAYRTREPNIGDAAELFDLNPVNILAQYDPGNGGNMNARTVEVIELPPRF